MIKADVESPTSHPLKPTSHPRFEEEKKNNNLLAAGLALNTLFLIALLVVVAVAYASYGGHQASTGLTISQHTLVGKTGSMVAVTRPHTVAVEGFHSLMSLAFYDITQITSLRFSVELPDGQTAWVSMKPDGAEKSKQLKIYSSQGELTCEGSTQLNFKYVNRMVCKDGCQVVVGKGMWFDIPTNTDGDLAKRGTPVNHGGRGYSGPGFVNPKAAPSGRRLLQSDKLHFFDFDNAKMLYKGDWAAYKKSRPHDNDCSIAESDNWKGAQQCVESWECRGARMCERGGWCSGFDGCEGSPLPTQAPGVSFTH